MKKTWNKALSCLILLIMAMQLSAVAYWTGTSNYHVHNPSPWAKEATVHLLEYHLIEAEAIPETDFNSIWMFQSELRRDHAAYLLVNLYEYQTQTKLAVPEDYPLDAWPYRGFHDEVKKAYGAGLMQGKSATSFGYDGLTRQEFAVILYRAAQQMDCIQDDVTADLSVFADAADIAPWAQEAVTYMLGAGIMVGTSDTTFHPNEVLTHEMAYVGIHRLALAHEIYEKLSDDIVSAFEFTPTKPVRGSLTKLLDTLQGDEKAVVEQALALYPNPYEMHVFAAADTSEMRNGCYASVYISAQNGDFLLDLYENGINAYIGFAYPEYAQYQALIADIIALSPYAAIHEARLDSVVQEAVATRDWVCERTGTEDSDVIQEGNRAETCASYSKTHADICIEINDMEYAIAS